MTWALRSSSGLKQSESLFIGGNLVLGCVTPPHVDIGGQARALAPVLKALELAIFGGYPQITPTPPPTSGLLSEARALRPGDQADFQRRRCV